MMRAFIEIMFETISGLNGGGCLLGLVAGSALTGLFVGRRSKRSVDMSEGDA